MSSAEALAEIRSAVSPDNRVWDSDPAFVKRMKKEEAHPHVQMFQAFNELLAGMASPATLQVISTALPRYSEYLTELSAVVRGMVD